MSRQRATSIVVLIVLAATIIILLLFLSLIGALPLWISVLISSITLIGGTTATVIAVHPDPAINLLRNTDRKIAVSLSVLILLLASGGGLLIYAHNLSASSPPLQTAPKTITTLLENKEIPCVGCQNPGINVLLDSISIDLVKKDMTWNFTITNNGSSLCTSIYFNVIQLEDQEGMLYPAQGQAKDIWSMPSGTSKEESPLFPFYPRPNEPYKLNLEIDSTPDCGTALFYQAEPFSFSGDVLGIPPTFQVGIQTLHDYMEKEIPCVSCQNSGIQVRIENIRIDTVKKDMIWNFTIINNGSSPCTRMYFRKIQLEDQAGMLYAAQGQARDIWSMNPRTEQVESPIFSFLPRNGEPYKLSLEIGMTHTCGSVNMYLTESFTL